MSDPAIIDLSFRLQGQSAPRDHGYALYAGISRIVPVVHGARWLGIHPLRGTRLDAETLLLSPHAALCLRLPAERIPDVLLLAGHSLDVGGCRLHVGVPTVHALKPAASVDAQMVSIKLTDAPRRSHPTLDRPTLDVSAFAARYEAEIRRQLLTLGIERPFRLCGRQSLTVGGRRIVGFSVRVTTLTDDESVRLQAQGLGGKRTMGCGIFRPTRGKVPG